MGQDEILKFLKGKDYLLVREIAEGIDIGPGSVSKNITNLFNEGYLDRKNIGIRRQEFYKYKLKKGVPNVAVSIMHKKK